MYRKTARTFSRQVFWSTYKGVDNLSLTNLANIIKERQAFTLIQVIRYQEWILFGKSSWLLRVEFVLIRNLYIYLWDFVLFLFHLSTCVISMNYDAIKSCPTEVQFYAPAMSLNTNHLLVNPNNWVRCHRTVQRTHKRFVIMIIRQYQDCLDLKRWPD